MTAAPARIGSDVAQLRARLVTRAEAKARGLKRYFTGVPCPNGHVEERSVSSRGCMACLRANGRKWLLANPSKKQDADRRWRKENAERLREHKRQYDQDNREATRERKRRWNAANPEGNRARALSWQRNNPEKSRARKRQWEIANPEKKRAKWHLRRARQASAEGSFSKADVRRLRDAQLNKCAGCKVGLDHGYHIDHITPIAKGGTNWPNNLQLLCPPCNLSKGAKDPIEWAQERGALI